MLDEILKSVRGAFGQDDQRAIVSAAPGAGPEAARESDRPTLGAGNPRGIPQGAIGAHTVKGADALGFGGHGDAIYLDSDNTASIAEEIIAHARATRPRGLRTTKPTERIRLAKAMSLDAHVEDWDGNICGPLSLFDGTIAAPTAGTNQQLIPISVPAGQPSPVLLMYRYPGIMYVSLYLTTFSFVPTGTTTTGLQEVWFSDITGATIPLGVYVGGNQTVGAKQTVGALCSGPLTDPGNAQLGTLVVNNIGIAGTPTTVRYQLGISYVGFYPDPWFNEQVLTPPTPSEIAETLETVQAQG